MPRASKLSLYNRTLFEISLILSILVISTLIKIWRLGEHAFVFDEAIHVAITKSFATNGFSWQVEREIGSVHMPLQYFVMGWWWQLAGTLWPGMSEEAIFRLPSVIMSSLTVPLVYLICRRFGLIVAMSATMFFAFHPYVLVYTRFASLDFPALFWLTLGIFVYLKVALPSRPGGAHWAWLWLSGFLFGVAGMTKAYSLLILGPVTLHSLLQGWPKYWGLGRALRQGGQVVAVSLATVAGLSWLLAQNPILLYEGFQELLETLYALPSTMVNRPELELFGFLRDEAIGIRQVLQTIWSHVGPGAFLVGLAGAFRLMEEDRQIGRSGSFFVIFIVIGMIAFAPFHWPRYLLVMGSVIPILFAFGIKDIYLRLTELKRRLVGGQARIAWSGLLAVGLLIAGVASTFPLMQIHKMYRIQMVDDWVYGDGMKEAAIYIKGKVQKGDWVMTNGHYTILNTYGGFPSHFYMGFAPQLRVYQIYNPQSKKPAVVDVDWMEESKLKFIVVDNTPNTMYTFLFSAQVGFSYALVNTALLSYIDNYFKPVADFKNGVVRVYQRSSRNSYQLLPQTKVWVGEGGAGWKENLANYNGWISGEGWAQSKVVTIGNETYWARPAQRVGTRSADFFLPVADTSREATLEIMYQDIGDSKVTISSRLAETKERQMDSKKEGQIDSTPFLRPLGEIWLINSGAIKTATIPLHPFYYYDASPDIPGYQQHFSFFTQGSAIPIIQVSLSQ